MRVLVATAAMAAILCSGCPAERSPFCKRWFALDERAREGEIRGQVLQAPEPSTLLMLFAGGGLLLFLRRP